jgi:pimeloyl-ACP methyl ester carboxylesterase
LLGVFTSPVSTPLDIGAIVLTGGGFYGSTHRNRLNVRICRELASQGFHALRLDWHGVGDSTGSVDRFHLDRPFPDDVLGASSWLVQRGIRRTAIVGSCFGARSALAAAARIDGLEAMLLVSTPIRSGRSEAPASREQRLAEGLSTWAVLRRGLRPSTIAGLRNRQRRRTAWRFAVAKVGSPVRRIRSTLGADDATPDARGLSWVSDDVIASLELAAARAPVALVYGDRDDFFADFTQARAGRLHDVLLGGEIEVEILPGEVHGFQSVEAQDAVLRSVQRWASAVAGRASTRAIVATTDGDDPSGRRALAVER